MAMIFNLILGIIFIVGGFFLIGSAIGNPLHTQVLLVIGGIVLALTGGALIFSALRPTNCFGTGIKIISTTNKRKKPYSRVQKDL